MTAPPHFADKCLGRKTLRRQVDTIYKLMNELFLVIADPAATPTAARDRGDEGVQCPVAKTATFDQRIDLPLGQVRVHYGSADKEPRTTVSGGHRADNLSTPLCFLPCLVAGS
jgi:hypothetical protein